MNQQNNEQVSALIDDELDGNAREQAIGHLMRDQDSRRTAVRYRMIGEAMRGESVFPQSLDLSDQISKALADEPTILAPKQKTKKRRKFVMPMIGGAIAASVAAATVIFVPQWFGSADVSTSSSIVQAPQNPAQPVKWRTYSEGSNNKLNRYLMEHNEIAGRTGVNGPAAHVSLVSYGAR